MFGSIDRKIDPPFYREAENIPMYTLYIVVDVDIFLHNMQWHVIMLKFLYHNVSITVVIRIPVTSGMMKCNVTAVMFCVTRHMSRGVTYIPDTIRNTASPAPDCSHLTFAGRKNVWLSRLPHGAIHICLFCSSAC